MDPNLLQAAEICILAANAHMPAAPSDLAADPKQADPRWGQRMILYVNLFTEFWNFFYNPATGALVKVGQPGGLLALPAGVKPPPVVPTNVPAVAPATALGQALSAATQVLSTVANPTP
jgi:hypothetical protein